MAYQSLYRKYRPQTFADVVGQGHVTRTLQNAIASGRIAHGYLFTGTRGTAKTTVARLLAKALNCESSDKPVAEPCNQCPACLSITSGGNIDVIEMDAASHRGVADIEEVRKSVGYGPMELRYKVFIIDEAHQLSSDAKDAFLKTLEEPPPNVVFILATTEPQAIPITIRSRCQQFDFKRGSLADITGRLSYVLKCEGVSFTPDAVAMVARGAEGSYRDSLSLLEQVLAFSPERLNAADVHQVLGTLDAEALHKVVDAVAQRDAPTLFALAGEMLDAGKEARTILRALIAHFRDLLLVSIGGPAVAAELTPDEIPALQDQMRAFSPPQIMQAMDVLNEAQSETRWNNQQRFLIERTFLKLLTLGASPATPIQTAPIVFAAAPVKQPEMAAEVPLIAPPVPMTAPPIAPPRPAPAPEPKEVIADDAALELPADYFAEPEDASDEDAIDESDLLDEADEETPVSSVTTETDSSEILIDAPDDRADAEPPDNSPGLFDMAVPDDEPDAGDDTMDFDRGGDAPAPTPTRPVSPPAALIEPIAEEAVIADRRPANPPVLPAAPDKEPNLFTLEMVMQIWPHFMADASRISKKTQMMMAQALPTEVSGATLVIVFSNRAALDMMSDPKGTDFVRKLLLRRLGIEKLTLRFALSESALPPPVRQQTKKIVKDPIAALDDMDDSREGFGDSNGYYPPAPPARANGAAQSHFAVAPARPAYPAPVASGTGRPEPRKDTYEAALPAQNGTMRHNGSNGHRANEPEPGDEPAGANHPLVEDVLTIFGGSIVRD